MPSLNKVMLIGSSDSATADAGKLRVTLHHNSFDRNVQRTPRVRFGQVHVFNNYYRLEGATYSYSWGVGVQSQIFAQNNYFDTNGTVAPSRFISRFNGNVIFVGDTLVDGHSRHDHVDVDAVALRARSIHLLEPEHGPDSQRIDETDDLGAGTAGRLVGIVQQGLPERTYAIDVDRIDRHF